MKNAKILCLHGYRQNSKIFRCKIGAIKKTLKNYNLIFIDGPHLIPYENRKTESLDEENGIVNKEIVDENKYLNNYGWWTYTNENNPSKIKEINTDTVIKTISYLKNICDKDGPFEGIMGFSQGGTCAALLLYLQDKIKEFSFKFAIIVSARLPSNTILSLWPIDVNRKNISTNSFHLMGGKDEVVPISESKALASIITTEKSIIFIHSGGHYIPTNKDIRTKLIDFIQSI